MSQPRTVGAPYEAYFSGWRYGLAFRKPRSRMYGSHIHDVIANAMAPAAPSRTTRAITFVLFGPQRKSTAALTTIM